MSDAIGEAQIGVTFDFLAKALTKQGIEEGSIAINQYFLIKKIESREDDQFLVLDCEVYEDKFN